MVLVLSTIAIYHLDLTVISLNWNAEANNSVTRHYMVQMVLRDTCLCRCSVKEQFYLFKETGFNYWLLL